MRTSARVILIVSLASIFAGPPLPTMAQQQPASDASAGALIGGATAAVISAEAELTATIFTFQSSDVPVARYRYYRWRGGCYVRYPSDNYAPVPSDPCS